MAFEPGRPLLHRHFTRTDLVWAPLTRVVSDDEYGLLLWLPTGSPVIRQLSLAGEGPRDMPFADWIQVPKQVVETTYRGPSTLKLNPPGAAYSVWWLFTGGRFAAWYVNLEEPSSRWDDGSLAGVDTTDQDLDIWIWPDRSWEWKDEDELEERLAFPEHYWVADAGPVWAQGRAVVPLVEAGAYPFDGTWCDFRPDPQWTVPSAVPDGWRRPRAPARLGL